MDRDGLIARDIIKPNPSDLSEKEQETMSATTSRARSQKFHNPYHFVPVKKPDFDQEGLSWLDIERSDANRREGLRKGIQEKGCTHDRYLPGRFHGRIICSLTTKTPIFVGARRVSEGSDSEPARVAPFELAGRPAIPASTLRGMISSVLEAASSSALRVLDKRMLSVRKPPEKPLRKIGIVKVKKIEEGRKRYFVFPLHPQKIKAFRDGKDLDKKPLITYSKKNPQFYLYKRDHNGRPILKREESVREDDRASYKKGIVRHFPFPPSKWDLFLPFEGLEGLDNEGLIEIPDEVVKKFLSLANERAKACKKGDKELFPYLPKGALRNENGRDDITVELKAGDIIFFDKKEISEIAFSSIWRMSWGGTVHDFFSNIHPELLPFNPERQKVSPAELIFGFVEDWTDKEKGESDKALAYAGRVLFSHGILQEEEGKEPYMDEVTLKILASPKPPCPCMYFYCKKNGSYVFPSKAEPKPMKKRFTPQGRKMYLHKNIEIDDSPWEAEKPEENCKQKAKITPLKSGSTFHFHIDFENLTKNELGLLLYSLRPSPDFMHKIGMGKPIGLGTVEVTPLVLLTIDRTKRYEKENPFEDGPRFGEVYGIASKGKEELSAILDSFGCYGEEAKALGSVEQIGSIDELSSYFAGQMDKDIKTALELIGDPRSVEAPVLYPYCHNLGPEKELFKWFGQNEKKKTQFLEPIEGGKIKLKPLTTEYCDKND